MARRSLLRSRHIQVGGGITVQTSVAQMEELIKAQYQEIWKNHLELLEIAAEEVESDARYLVPKETGELEDSIIVYVSRSPRYPGIIAKASAKGRYKTGTQGYAGYDYAYTQHEREDYSHDEPEESAHYLAGPFALAVARVYRQLTGEKMHISKLSPELYHAAMYVKDKLK